MRAISAMEGAVLGGLSAYKLETHPAPTGPSTVVEFFENVEMAQEAASVTRDFELSGFASFDFMIEAQSGAAYLIELNPRPTPVCHLGGAFGDDLCGALWQQLTGTPPRAAFSPAPASRPAPAWRRVLAVAVELLPPLAVWRFTYVQAPWVPTALLFLALALSLPLLGGSPGQWLLGLRQERNGRRAGFPRGMLRFALCYAWLPAACAFLAAAYASSPYSSPLGLGAGALLVAWLAGGLGVLAPQKAGLFDQLLGTAVVRR
jgi:hypothetical protein